MMSLQQYLLGKLAKCCGYLMIQLDVMGSVLDDQINDGEKTDRTKKIRKNALVILGS